MLKRILFNSIIALLIALNLSACSQSQTPPIDNSSTESSSTPNPLPSILPISTVTDPQSQVDDKLLQDLLEETNASDIDAEFDNLQKELNALD